MVKTTQITSHLGMSSTTIFKKLKSLSTNSMLKINDLNANQQQYLIIQIVYQHNPSHKST
jgi:hypothetical protein